MSELSSLSGTQNQPESSHRIQPAEVSGQIEVSIASESIPDHNRAKRRGRPLTTGRYETREELVSRVWSLYDMPEKNISQIARICEVSLGTVSKILSNHPRA